MEFTRRVTHSDAETTDESPAAPANPSRLLAYLQLFRAPNLFTAVADVAMGYFVTAFALRDPRAAIHGADLGLLVITSCALYTAGMVLNDVFDFEVDRRERPQRPLPSGRISRRWAKGLGFGLLVFGIAMGSMTGMLATRVGGPAWRPGAVAALLAASILLYDGLAKKWAAGAVVMGACRFLNVLLGMSLHAAPYLDSISFAGFHSGHLLIAGGIGLYIVGVTVFARKEAGEPQRGMLVAGVAIMAAGIVLLAIFPRFHPQAWDYRLDPNMVWPLGLGFISIWILRRCLVAVVNPSPANVQSGVKFCLMSLIILDALVCLAVGDSPYAIGILALIFPTIVLGGWLYST